MSVEFKRIHHVAYRCKDAKETWTLSTGSQHGLCIGHCRKRSATHQRTGSLHVRFWMREWAITSFL